MSRNLCQTDCPRCGSKRIRVWDVREGTKDDFVHRYYDEFQTMLVGDAECTDCGCKLLAWVRPPIVGIHNDDKFSFCDYNQSIDGTAHFFDLSYRSTFNDEPGPDDLPTPDVLVHFPNVIADIGSNGDTEFLWAVYNLLSRLLGCAETKQ